MHYYYYILHSEPQIRGNNAEIFENRSPVRVCVDLRGATQSTSQDLTITFTPQLKSLARNQATRKNMKLYFRILQVFSLAPLILHTVGHSMSNQHKKNIDPYGFE